jgi:hypothetical protein
MTDQLYDEREDERGDKEAARGPTEREEEGKPFGAGEHDEQDEDESPSS